MKRVLLAVALWLVLGACSVPSFGVTTTCTYNFNSGSGATLFNFCVTINGNIVKLTSPSGYEHIRLSSGTTNLIREGYGLCDVNANVHYNDYGASGTVNWNSATVQQPNGAGTLPLIITRSTSDGRFTLKQTFNRNTAERIITVAMALTNKTGSALPVHLLRYVDLDANNADGPNGGDFKNLFDHGADAVWGYNTFYYGVMLYTTSPAITHSAEVASRFGVDPCSLPGVGPLPILGDYGMYINHNIASLGAGATQSVIVEYKRF